MIKLVIFDAYGVVLNGGYPATCKYLAKKFGSNWKHLFSIIYTKYFNMAAEKKITQKQAWEMAIKELKLPITRKGLLKIHYSFMSLNKPLISLVKKLKMNNLLLSKNTRSQFNDAEKQMHFRKYFKNVINTWELGLPKASKKTCNYIFRRFNIKPNEVIYTDDQEQNLVDAKELGVNAILYKNFKQFKKEFEKLTL
jgi:putative hydrolase of the HAD superfamily